MWQRKTYLNTTARCLVDIWVFLTQGNPNHSCCQLQYSQNLQILVLKGPSSSLTFFTFSLDFLFFTSTVIFNPFQRFYPQHLISMSRHFLLYSWQILPTCVLELLRTGSSHDAGAYSLAASVVDFVCHRDDFIRTKMSYYWVDGRGLDQ